MDPTGNFFIEYLVTNANSIKNTVATFGISGAVVYYYLLALNTPWIVTGLNIIGIGAEVNLLHKSWILGDQGAMLALSSIYQLTNFSAVIYGINQLGSSLEQLLAKISIIQALRTSLLANEMGTPISILDRWSDTAVEAAWRADAVAWMKELTDQGISEADAMIQAADEFGIYPNQVKISTGTVKNPKEVDVFISKDTWESWTQSQQEYITAKLKEIYNVPTVDYRQTLSLIPGWPDPATTIPPGSITFNPNGTVIHDPFAK